MELMSAESYMINYIYIIICIIYSLLDLEDVTVDKWDMQKVLLKLL